MDSQCNEKMPLLKVMRVFLVAKFNGYVKVIVISEYVS
jgi:hypothetical protein